MRWHFAFLLGALALLFFRASAHAVLPDDVTVGSRVEVDGHISGPGEIQAMEVQVKRAPTGSDEVEGSVESVDAAGRQVVLGTITVSLSANAVITDHDGKEIDLTDVTPGMKGDAEGRFEGGVLRADAFEVEEMDPDEVRDVELEGTISHVDATRGGFRLLGAKVLVGPRTRVILH